jgi:hypothetical protein
LAALSNSSRETAKKFDKQSLPRGELDERWLRELDALMHSYRHLVC